MTFAFPLIGVHQIRRPGVVQFPGGRLPKLTGDITVTTSGLGINGALRGLSGSIAVSSPALLHVAGTLPKRTAALVIDNAPRTFAITGTLKKLTAALAASVTLPTQTLAVDGTRRALTADINMNNPLPINDAVAAYDMADIDTGTNSIPDLIGSADGITHSITGGDLGTFSGAWAGVGNFNCGFDGGYISVPTNAVFKTDEISFSLVMETSNSGVGDQYLGGKWFDGSIQAVMMLGNHGSAPNGGVVFHTTGDIFMNLATSIRDGAPHHLCFTYDKASGTGKIYVDGVLDSTNNASAPGAALGTGTNNSDFGMGAIESGGSWFGAPDCRVGRFRWWGRPLTAGEVAADADPSLS